MQIDVASVEKAIDTVRFSRQTHEHWILWYERYPNDESKYGETVGDRKHHADAIAGYDQVLSVLEAVRRTL